MRERTQAATTRVYVHALTRACVSIASRLVPRAVSRRDVLLLISLDPRASFTIETTAGACRTNAAAVMPGTPHRVTDGPMPLGFTVPPVHPRYAHLQALFRQPVLPLDRTAFRGLDARLHDAWLDEQAQGRCAVLAEDAIEVVLAGHRPARATDPRVLSAVRALFNDLNCSFRRLAAEQGLSPSRLSHLFAEHLGLSMRDCQAWSRMARAWEMVVWHRELTLTDIAHQLAFSDSSHLARSFRLTYGQSPSAWRDGAVARLQHAGTSDRPAGAGLIE